ncbi:MAG: hypothetical protein KatS3mg105_3763 [Gemmatales bacterium]|nr:MAG: hypothetical protein KatS3mg105_3763 [Gemmatales bacterium]
MPICQDQFYRRIVQLYQQGRIDVAAQTLEAALDDDNTNGPLWELMGVLHAARRRFPQAIGALETATTLVPLTPLGQCVLANCYARTGHPDIAHQIYTYLLSHSDLPGELFPAIAKGFGHLGDPAMALEACRRAAEREIDRGESLFGMAYYMSRLHYPAEWIISVLRQAVQLDPNCFQYRIALAALLQKQNQLLEAYEVLARLSCDDLRAVDCVPCLARMRTVFETFGDRQRADVCQEQLEKTPVLTLQFRLFRSHFVAGK